MAGVVLPLVIFVAFLRWLSPAEIGAIALGVAAAEIVKACGLPGLYEALLQRRDDAGPARETALAVLLAAGLGLFAAFVPAALWLAPDLPGAGLALALLGLRIPLDLVALQPQAVLAAGQDYRRLALRGVVATVGAGGLGLGLGAAGQPFWGLVFYQVALPVLALVAVSCGTGTLVRPRFHRAAWRALWPEAGRASAHRLVGAVGGAADQVLVGAVAGPAASGFYSAAKRVETMLQAIGHSFGSILFQPVFARRTAGTDGAELRRGLRVLTATCGLAAALVTATADRLLPLVLGPAWDAAAPIAALLALHGFARVLGSPVAALLSVSGRNGVLLRVSLVSAASTLGIVALLAPVGLLACAAALVIRGALVAGWLAWLTRHDLPRVGMVFLVDVVLPVLAMAAAARLALEGAAPALAGLVGVGPWATCGALAAAGSAGAAVAAAMVLLWRLPAAARVAPAGAA